MWVGGLVREQSRIVRGYDADNEKGGGGKGENWKVLEGIYLLAEHDDPGCPCSAAVAVDGEELPDHVPPVRDFPLDLNINVAVIEISRGLDIRRADFAKGFKSFRDTIFLNEPAGALRAEIDLAADDEGENDGGSKHEPPIQIMAYVQEGHAHYIAEHDAEGGPHLPHHYQSAADGSG